MDKQSISYKTLKNIAYGFVGYAVPILVSIVVTPVIIHRLGIEDYGVYVLATTIIAFLSLLDFGFTVSLMKFVSEDHAKGDRASLNRSLRTGHSLYLIIGILGLAVFYLVGKFFLPLFKISAASVVHIQTVFLLAGLTFFVTSLMALYQVIPNALQRYDVTTKLQTAQLILSQIAILIAVLLGYKLKVIFFINLLAAVGLLVAYRFSSRKLLPEAAFGFSWDKEKMKKIFGFGSLAALTNISSSALIQLDRLIIPIFLGPAQLAYYSVPGGAVSKIPGITSSLSGIFFPLASSLQSLGETEKLKKIYTRTFRNLSLIAASLTFALVIFARKILLFWIGPDFAQKSAEILVILAFTHYILSLYQPLTNFLLGLGKVKLLAYNSTALALLNLALLFILIPKWGIIGAAWAYLLSVIPLVFIFYWTERKIFNLTGSGMFYLKLYAKLLSTAAAAFVLVRFALYPAVNSRLSLIFIGPLSIAVYLIIYKLFGFVETEDWELAKSFGRQIKLRVLGNKVS